MPGFMNKRNMKCRELIKGIVRSERNKKILDHKLVQRPQRQAGVGDKREGQAAAKV
jgi:hypothetical protein